MDEAKKRAFNTKYDNLRDAISVYENGHLNEHFEKRDLQSDLLELINDYPIP